MTTNLLTLKADDTLEKVDNIFNSNDFRHLPVIDDEGKLIGLISKSDYLALCEHLPLFRKEYERSYNLRFFRSILVEQVMSKQLAKLRAEDPVSLAADIFKENLFHAIPIVEAKGELVGMVTTIDLINYAFAAPVPRIE